jgi:hypothetical protein
MPAPNAQRFPNAFAHPGCIACRTSHRRAQEEGGGCEVGQDLDDWRAALITLTKVSAVSFNVS